MFFQRNCQWQQRPQRQDPLEDSLRSKRGLNRGLINEQKERKEEKIIHEDIGQENEPIQVVLGQLQHTESTSLSFRELESISKHGQADQ